METENQVKCGLVGIPDHEAVLNVGGRIGAALGPKKFREYFYQMRGQKPVSPHLKDCGDINPITDDISKNHNLAAKLISEAHKRYQTTLVVGGSHDHGYSQLLGVKNSLSSKAKMGCINIDAHLDVRSSIPKITSGSPFYLAVENNVLNPKDFIEFGIQRHCNAQILWDYVKSKKIEVLPLEKMRQGKAVATFQKALKKLKTRCDFIVISFDLDAVASAFAPGVSAPQSEGLSATEALEIAEISGSEKAVTSFGIFELNPVHDVDDKTSRLAATLAYHFLSSRI